MPTAASPADIEFFWDPVCPFAWITSRWVEKVAAQTDYAVEWRFISLRLLNKDKDYATEFPPEYEQGHTAGLRMLRVAAAVRDDLGPEPLGPLVTAYGESYWDKPRGSGMRDRLSTADHVGEVLAAADLPTRYARRPRRHGVGSTPRRGDRAGAVSHRPRRRHPHHHVPPS